jgi:hypothetical protein
VRCSGRSTTLASLARLLAAERKRWTHEALMTGGRPTPRCRPRGRADARDAESGGLRPPSCLRPLRLDREWLPSENVSSRGRALDVVEATSRIIADRVLEQKHLAFDSGCRGTKRCSTTAAVWV